MKSALQLANLCAFADKNEVVAPASKPSKNNQLLQIKSAFFCKSIQCMFTIELYRMNELLGPAGRKKKLHTSIHPKISFWSHSLCQTVPSEMKRSHRKKKKSVNIIWRISLAFVDVLLHITLVTEIKAIYPSLIPLTCLCRLAGPASGFEGEFWSGQLEKYNSLQRFRQLHRWWAWQANWRGKVGQNISQKLYTVIHLKSWRL